MTWSKKNVAIAVVGASACSLALGLLIGPSIRPSAPPASPVVAAPPAGKTTSTPPKDLSPTRSVVDGVVVAEPIDMAALPTTDWVTLNDPARSWAGYTLLFYERRVPMLIDMNGNVVHSWPSVRAVGRARLTPTGSLVYIAVDDSLVEVDWDGRPVRSFRTGNGKYFPHHDLQWTPDGGLLGIFRAPGLPTDNVLAVDSVGEVSWTWESHVHIAEELKVTPFKESDLTHFNSVQSIPNNPHARAGDARFAEGNVLVSSRHLSTVFLVDRSSGEVTWKYSKGLDWQHEAILLGDDVPGAGNVMVFNNRYHSEDRQSEVLEIDPITNEVVWRYTDERFFSDTAGTAQKLPNGNVLITSSRGGRIFEVDPEGEIVWQWVPPHNTMRVQRYPADFCPQLAALPTMFSAPVRSRQPQPHIDEALYDFALSKEVTKLKVDGKKRLLLSKANDCQELMLPGRPALVMDFGFSNADALSPEESQGSVKVTFARPGGPAETVYERAASLETDGIWTRDRVRLDREWGYETVEACVISTASDLSKDTRKDHKGFVVGAPKIASGYRASRRDLPDVNGKRDKRSQKAERTLQERQLKELGYIE